MNYSIVKSEVKETLFQAVCVHWKSWIFIHVIDLC